MSDLKLTESDRMEMMASALRTAKKRGRAQNELTEALEDIALRRVYADGTPVRSEGAVMQAMKMLHSMVPEKVLEKAVGVDDEEAKEMRIRLVLDASSDDPRVSVEMLEEMFVPAALPEPVDDEPPLCAGSEGDDA